MFEHLCIAHCSSYGIERPLDEKMVLNALLFYRRVDVVTDFGGLWQLIDLFTPEGLHRLYKEGRMRITYIEGRPVYEKTGRSRYTVHIVHERTFLLDWALRRLLVVGDHWANGEYWAQHLEHVMGNTGHGREFGPFFKAMNDVAFASAAVRELLQRAYPQVGDYGPLQFYIEGEENEFTVYTNLDDTAPQARGGLNVSEWCFATLLDLFLSIQFAADFKSELGVDSFAARLLELRLLHALKPAMRGIDEVHLFSDLVLKNSSGVADAVLSRDRSMAEYFELIGHADRFRDWLIKAEPESSILTHYLREVTTKSWLSTLKGGLLKWSVFQGANVLASTTDRVGVSVLASLAELATLVGLEHLAQGWKPHNFVELTRQFAGPDFGGRSMRLGPQLVTGRQVVAAGTASAVVQSSAQPARCAATTKLNRRCARTARSGTRTCWQHTQ